MFVPDFESEADEGANNDCGIHDVPQVTEVRARVEQDAQIYYLQQHLHGEHARERVVEIVQDFIPIKILPVIIQDI